jgi:hypothetical protein
MVTFSGVNGEDNIFTFVQGRGEECREFYFHFSLLLQAVELN